MQGSRSQTDNGTTNPPSPETAANAISNVLSGISPTPPPLYTSEDGSEKSLLSDGKKQTDFYRK